MNVYIKFIILLLLVGILYIIYRNFKTKNKDTNFPIESLDKNNSKQNDSTGKYFIQTYKTQSVPENMRNVVLSNKILSHDFTRMFFDDIDASNFIYNYFPGVVSDVFDKLIPGAFKADIFRLAVLYNFGGVYADICMKLVQPLNKVFRQVKDTNDHFLLLAIDRPQSKPAIYQAFLVASPKNPILYKILMQICEDLKDFNYDKDEEYNDLSFTGPIKFAEVLNSILGRSKNSSFLNEKYISHKDSNIIFWDHDDYKITDENGDIFLHTKYKGWKKDRPKGSHYSDLVKNKKVFYPYLVKDKISEKDGLRICHKGVHFMDLQNFKMYQIWDDKTNGVHLMKNVKYQRETMRKMNLLEEYDQLDECFIKDMLWALSEVYLYGGWVIDINIITDYDLPSLTKGNIYMAKNCIFIGSLKRNEKLLEIIQKLLTYPSEIESMKYIKYINIKTKKLKEFYNIKRFNTLSNYIDVY